MNEQYDTWQEAFDACRERDAPLKVRVKDEVGKIYPSGSAIGVHRSPLQEDTIDDK